MSSPPDIRAQLQALSIPKESRPPANSRNTRRHASRWWIVIVAVALGAAAWAALVGRGQWGDRLHSLVTSAAPPPDIKLVTVVRRTQPPVQPVLTATGKIVSDHEVQVATKVSGQIVALYFEQGDRVEKGQVLAHVEDVLYRARRDQAAAELQRAKVNREYQRVNLARVASLSENASAASIEYADAVRAADESEANVAATTAILAAAQKALDDCEVTAPIAGVILQRAVEVGDFVSAEGGRGANANALFASIADMTKLRVEVDVSELDIARIHKDMPCLVIPDADKSLRYAGHVMWLDPGANYSKATVQVKVRIENPDARLRVEGSAQVAFLPQPPEEPTITSAPSLWIPRSAARKDPTAGDVVFAPQDGILRRIQVTLGKTSADQVEVLTGLTEGQTIVAEATGSLQDGQRMPR